MAERYGADLRATPGQLLCKAGAGPYGFLCTREDGHPGRHVAQGEDGETYARWPDGWDVREDDAQ